MKKVYLDTNIYIYLFQDHPKYFQTCKKIVDQAEKENAEIVSSTITLIELIQINKGMKTIEILKNSFYGMHNLSMYSVDQNIAELAAEISREYKLELADGIHVATARYAKTAEFITNDKKIKRIKELKILYLDELV